ncbi:MAG: HD-GYP domain-containing protein [Terriglobales bacterium]
MSTASTPAVIKPSVSTPPGRGLPFLAFFETDDVARKAIVTVHRFRKIPFENLHGHPAEVDRILITASERLLSQFRERMRAQNFRVIALSDEKFKDPRLDGAVFAYLPLKTSGELIERMVDNALDHIHLHQTRRESQERLSNAAKEIDELNKIGAALSAEHDAGKLLDMILTKCREITNSDAGSLYLVEQTDPVGLSDSQKLAAKEETAHKKERKPIRMLRFKLAQNDSVPVTFKEITMDISEKSIAGFVALHGTAVILDDAYHLPEGSKYTVNRKFDEDSGYRTKSILAVPMRNPQGEVVGVVQLINAKREFRAKLNSVATVTEQVRSFTQRQQEVVQSLASQAAVAYENSVLYESIQRLFEGFVKASVTAIESRDPTTSGHSFRVANLTVGLAEAVDRADSGLFADVRFSRSEMRELRYASLLHDFGKVGVREEVLVKAKKLYPSQLELIEQRFQFVKRTMQTEVLNSQLQYALEKGREDFLKKQPEFDQKLADQMKALDDHFATVLKSDEPTVLPEGNFEKLLEIAARNYLDFDGTQKPLLSGDEVRLLSIRKGSLDDRERVQIESHVVHTFNFLQQIPWTKEIRNVPEIARGHHEKLNGLGYPYKLSAAEIPMQTRMMTISDIFDALSATDRPYKKAVNLEKALDILRFSVKDGELDPELYKVFLEAKVYERWKIEPYPY